MYRNMRIIYILVIKILLFISNYQIILKHHSFLINVNIIFNQIVQLMIE